MKNEATKTLEHYFRNESNTVYYLGKDLGVNLFRDVLENGQMIAGDAPDMVIVKGDVAIIIEHFEFDSSHVNRKGSTSRAEQARIEREQSQIQPILGGVIYHGKIKASCSYDDYILNVSRTFSEHYKRIPTYKSNLIKNGTLSTDMTFKTMFLIDDVSPLGSIAFDCSEQRNQMVPIILARVPEFLELLSGSLDLDYVLCCSSTGSNEFVWFIDLGEIPAYREKQLDYAAMRFLSNHPSVLVGKILIPEKQTN